MSIEFASNVYSYAYFVALFIPILVRAGIGMQEKRIIRIALWWLVSASAMAILVIAAWKYLDISLEQHLLALDRNGDSVWTDEEQKSWSKTDWSYYNLAMADGGRNVFSFFVFPIFSLIYTFIIFCLFSFTNWLRKKSG